ncbi:MAG: ABC transporter ATP-binding protein [Myxococcota bacterium]
MADEEQSQGDDAPVLRFEDLHKEFKLGLRLERVHAVKGVSLEVRSGEIFGFLGPNGAGKTTSMKIAMGLIQATSGRAELFGRSIEDPAVRRRVGYLPEQPYFYDYLSAFEILDFYGQLYEIPRKERRHRVDALLDLVGLSEARNRTLRRFSKGMLQRVGIAQAIINDPDLIVLDEPLSGLDPMGRKEVRDIIISLREQGKTVFFSSHILHDIETICDRVGLLIDGRLERLGPLDDLLAAEEPRVDVVATDVGPELAEHLGGMDAEVSRVGASFAIQVSRDSLEDALRALLDGGARVTHVDPHKESLEDLFVREAGGHTRVA